MFIIKYKKIFIIFSITMVIVSIVLLSIFGLKLGIDFKGGAMLDVDYPAGRPSQEILQDTVKQLDMGEIIIQPIGETGYSIKTKNLTEVEHNKIIESLKLSGKYELVEKNFNSIGPSVGKELARKSIIAIILVSLAIILFISYAFRKVSKPVSSWKYGLIAIVTLLHDIAIPTGLFTLLSHYRGVEVDTLFVVALLTVLGLSVSDTIVVFDRIRENLRYHPEPKFEDTVGKSLSQTFTRSINTSMTIILVLLMLYFFGPESTKTFSLVLTVGLFFGTYSSIFLASPLLTIVEAWQNKTALAKRNK